MGLIKRYNEEEFRQKVRINQATPLEKYDNLNTDKDLDYRNNNLQIPFFKTEDSLNKKFGIGNVGSPFKQIEKDGQIDYEVVNVGAIDNVNAYAIQQYKELNSIEDIPTDFIKFRISVVDTVDPSKIDLIVFRAYLDDLNDDYTGNYNSYKYNGRAEKFYTYNEFERKINFSFKVAAHTRQELLPLYQKLNYLVAQTSPEYSPQRRIRPKFSRLTIGDWCDDIPGFFTNVSLKWSSKYPWEINLEDSITQHPHALDVSCAFIPIHNFVPENKITTPYIIPNTPDKSLPNQPAPTELAPVDEVVDTNIGPQPRTAVLPPPIQFDPIIAVQDNTRVNLPGLQPPVVALDPSLLPQRGGTPGAGGFAGGGFGGGGAGSNY
jgi:hypothetical protein